MGILVWPKRLTNFLKPKPNYGLSSYLAELRKFSNSTFNYALHFTKMDNFEYTFGSHLLFGLETQDSMRGDACLSISCPSVFSLSQPRPYTIRFPPPHSQMGGQGQNSEKTLRLCFGYGQTNGLSNRPTQQVLESRVRDKELNHFMNER